VPLIEVPADALRLILQFDFGQDDPATYGISWFDTRQAQVDAGLVWAVRWSGGKFSELRKIAIECGRADLVQEAGLWEYLWHGRPSPVATFSSRNAWNIGFGAVPPMTALTSRLKVSWQPNYVEGSYEKTQELVSPLAARLDDRSGRRIDGTDQDQALVLPFVNDDATALAIGGAVLATRDHQVVTAALTGGWDALAVAKGDTVLVESPVLDDWGGSSIWFRVLGKTLPLQAGQGIGLTLLGLPPSVLALRGRVRLRLPFSTSLRGRLALETVTIRRGRVEVRTVHAPTLRGRLVIDTPFSTNLRGRLGTVGWPGSGPSALLETGDHLLLESGDLLLTE
jgi:hypothetical protein